MEQPNLEVFPIGARLPWQPTPNHCSSLALLTLSVIKDIPQSHQHQEFLLREQDRGILTELLLPRHVLRTRTSYSYHPFTTLSPFPNLVTNQVGNLKP